MSQGIELGPCAQCGKREGRLKGAGRSPFRSRFYVICLGCGFMTPVARTEGIAAKMWNEAKPIRE